MAEHSNIPVLVLQIVAYTLLILYYLPKIVIALFHWFRARKTEIGRQSTQHLLRKKLVFYFSQLLLLALFIRYVLMSFVDERVLNLIRDHGQELLEGLLLTLSVSLLSIVLGTIIGTLIAIVMTRKALGFARPVVIAVVYLLLSIPVLVLLVGLWYSSHVSGSVFIVSVVALSVNLTPFVAKIVEGSIRNLAPDQIDAAIAAGYDQSQIAWYFQIGYVIRNSIQPLLVEYYTTIKLSSLAGYIGLAEAFHTSQDIIRESQDPVSGYVILSLCYILLVSPIALMADFLETKWRPT